MNPSPPLPGPWVDPDIPDATPWTHNSGVVKFLEFPVRIAAMSRRAFHLYWMRHHSPHVMNTTPFSQFMRKYMCSHAYPDPTLGVPAHYHEATVFEGVGEVWISRLEDVDAWLGQPLYAGLIQPDESRFVRQDGSGEMIIAKEECLLAGEPDLKENDLTKVHVLMRRRGELGHDEFHAAMSAYGQALIAPPALRARLRRVVVSHRIREPWPEGLPLADIDAVMEFWFHSREDVGLFFQDEAARAVLARHEADCVNATDIRAVVGKLRVVHDEFSFQPSTMQPLAFAWE